MLYDFKGQSIKNACIGDFPNNNNKIKFKKRGYLIKKNMLSAGSNFTGEYLSEFETEFENILGC
jgi:hypothetical protein